MIEITYLAGKGFVFCTNETMQTIIAKMDANQGSETIVFNCKPAYKTGEKKENYAKRYIIDRITSLIESIIGESIYSLACIESSTELYADERYAVSHLVFQIRY